MTLIRKGLMGLAALLAFSAQPAQGKERDSKILQCPVAEYWQEFLEEQYAKSAPQAKTNEDKNNLRKGYCAFGSEKFPERLLALKTAEEYLKESNIDDPFLGVILYHLGNEYERQAKEFTASPWQSPEAIRQQLFFMEEYKQDSRRAYARAYGILKRAPSSPPFTRYLNSLKTILGLQ